MVESYIGIRGYVGEKIVLQWLKLKYPENEGYEVVEQIMPMENNVQKGGSYLDFGILKNSLLVEIFEVKTQDYAWGNNLKLNQSLRYLLKNKDTIEFKIQNRDEYVKAQRDVHINIVYLVPPNDEAIKKCGLEANNIKLFDEIFEDKDFQIHKDLIYSQLKEDLEKNIERLKRPKNMPIIKKDL